MVLKNVITSANERSDYSASQYVSFGWKVTFKDTYHVDTLGMGTNQMLFPHILIKVTGYSLFMTFNCACAQTIV